MEPGARQGSWAQIASSAVGLPCSAIRSADAGIPAYLGARRRRDVGCKMAFGVSRQGVVRPLVLGRLSSRAGSNKVAGSWSQIIDGGRQRGRRFGHRLSGGRGEGGLAGVAQRVVAATHKLAGDGDQGDVCLEAETQPSVVGVVR
jgi:hypothetical protein